METLEELKAIIAGKPEGSTHVERIISRGAVYFLKRVNRHGVYTYDLYSNDHGSYVDGGDISGEIRSLSDIERVIELMECLKSIEQTVEGGDVLGCWDMMKIKDCLK